MSEGEGEGSPHSTGIESRADSKDLAEPQFGQGDASFRAAGGEEGIERLVDRFYDLMCERPDAAGIRKMHPKDLAGSRDKLTRFLCGWLGGPKLYSERYGPIKLPKAHARFPIGTIERDAWLDCMAAALVDEPMAEDFKRYLMRELGVPAERIRRVVAERMRDAESLRATSETK
jgi:hemoglobin